MDAYNALQVHVDKRMSHDFQVGLSYTWSHALDEQSGLGLFYNGNNPLNLRSGYGFVRLRPHPCTQLQLRLPDSRFADRALVAGKVDRRLVACGVDGAAKRPALQHHRLLGRDRQHLLFDRRRHYQPGSAAGQGLHGQERAYGQLGAWSRRLERRPWIRPALHFRCCRPAGWVARSPPPIRLRPVSPPGSAISSARPFRSAPTSSLEKDTKFGQRYGLKYTFDVYNLTNTSSFDIPFNQVSQNQYYNPFPNAGTTPLPTGCTASGSQSNSSFYACPAGLGIVTHTIGSPRQTQMSLRLDF